MAIFLRTGNDEVKDVCEIWEGGCIPDYKKIDGMIDRLLELKNKMTDNDIKKHNEKFWEDFYKRQEQHSKERSIRKSKIAGYVYVVKFKDFYKMGRTKSLRKRLKTYDEMYPFKVEVLHTIQVDDYMQIETEILRKFRHRRIKGEWFKLSKTDLKQLNMLFDIYEKNN